MNKLITVILATLLPAGELRGSIPLGLYLGLDPLLVFFLTVSVNSLLFFPAYFAMELLYEKLFSKIHFLNRHLEGLRKKGNPYVKKYGKIGLLAFVAIGVYTASILSWLLGIKWKEAFPIITLGVLIAGIIVLTISLGAFNLRIL